jgi:hypothetical protein
MLFSHRYIPLIVYSLFVEKKNSFIIEWDLLTCQAGSSELYQSLYIHHYTSVVACNLSTFQSSPKPIGTIFYLDEIFIECCFYRIFVLHSCQKLT